MPPAAKPLLQPLGFGIEALGFGDPARVEAEVGGLSLERSGEPGASVLVESRHDSGQTEEA